jgi:hypothetical protein
MQKIAGEKSIVLCVWYYFMFSRNLASETAKQNTVLSETGSTHLKNESEGRSR